MNIFQNINEPMLIWAAIGILLTVGILIAAGRLGKAVNVAAKGAVGGAAIWGINAGVAAMGATVALPGINLLTVGIVGLLGAPGLVMVYGLNFIM
ncbi:MAG: pro-sigmaK processing inhibitor BofA family protein [Defluviitaleaceae bacterium]|nr:pro-sigmaK processing inhibitor BofA family protein [Defluviitaleaceae bacterium]